MSTLQILITAQNQAQAVLNSLQGQLGGLQSAANVAQRGFTGLQSAVGIGMKAAAGAGMAGFAALGGAAVLATNTFGNFQQSMNEVFTLLPGISQSAMDGMMGNVKAFATEFRVLPENVVPALYQSLSAGVPSDNVFEFIKIAQKAAMGGVTDLETAVDGITSVVNAYGAEMIDAAKASDIMFTAVKLGKTDFGQLSGSLFNVIPTAASLGVAFEDIGAGMARLTAQGTPTSVATTQLRALMVEAAKDGSKLSDTIFKLSGKSFAGLVAEGKNVGEILQMVRESMPDNDFRNLFSSVEASGAALGITGSQFEAFNEALAEMKNSTGATDAAFKTMDTGINRFKDGIKSFVSVAQLELGGRLAPIVEKAAGWFEGMLPAAMDSFTNILDGVFGFVDKVMGAFERLSEGLTLRDVIVEIGMLFGQSWEEASKFAQGIDEMGVKFMEILTPIWEALTSFVSWKDILIALGVVVASIVLPALGSIVAAAAPVVLVAAALVAAVALVRNAWENDWGGIRTALTTWWTGTGQPIFNQLRAWLGENIPKALSTLSQYWEDHLLPALRQVWNFAQTYLVPLLGALANLWIAGVKLQLAALKVVWETVLRPALQALWQFIVERILPAFDSADGKLGGFVRTIQNVTGWVNTLADKVGNLANRLWNLPSGAARLLGFAGGTGFAPGGMALVGERGPEMVYLPRGARVETAERTAAAMGGGGQQVVFAPNIYNNIDLELAFERFLSMLNERGR